MTKALVDTTVVYDQLLGNETQRARAVKALDGYDQSRTVAYAFRELRSGALGTWILAHNKVAEADTIEDAVDKLLAIGMAAPRKAQVAMRAIVRGLVAAKTAPATPEQDQRQALVAFLGAEAVRAWKSRKSTAHKVTHPLACFLQDDLVLEGTQLRTKSGRLGCQGGVSCSAAMHLKQFEVEIEKLVLALRPGKGEQQKPELSKMRAALKEVLASPKGDFPRKKCRALGDAYFCIVAEVDEDVVTTNKSDFAFLTKALGKNAVNP